MEFTKATKPFMGYETYFLKSKIVVLLNDPVKVVRCKTGNRLGLVNITENDRRILESHTQAMAQAFSGNMQTQGLFSTENGMIFMSADTATLYDENRDKVQILPRVSTCRLAILLCGVKMKDCKISFIAKVHQMKIMKVEDLSTECLFD
jgi:hypothetical protein